MTVHLHKHDLPAGIDFGRAVAVDTETQGLSLVRDKLCLVQLSAGDGDAHIVQMDRSSYDAPNLTALMVTHSMRQALDVGDRTLMLHEGNIAFDVQGQDREGLDVPDLLALFSKTKGEELSDDSLLLG